MIARLRIAGKRRVGLSLALALLFALAPAFSAAFAVPAASFTKTVVHSHDQHYGPLSHHYHDHDDGMLGDFGTAPAGDHLHVHYDACCPSVLVPVPVALLIDHRMSAAVDPPPTRALYGSRPSCLLRPPIV